MRDLPRIRYKTRLNVWRKNGREAHGVGNVSTASFLRAQFEPAAEAAAEMTPQSVLIADDEESVCALLEHWLLPMGCTITCVGSAREAIRLLDERRFDLVITDVLMPDGDGPDLIAKLQQRQPAARILAMSGGGRYMAADDCLKIASGLGAHAVVLKPFDRQGLLDGIARACAPMPQSEA